MESKYDKDTKALIFNATAQAADRVLTAEELAFKERNRLESLEYHRVKRMKGDEDPGSYDIVIAEGSVQRYCCPCVNCFWPLVCRHFLWTAAGCSPAAADCISQVTVIVYTCSIGVLPGCEGIAFSGFAYCKNRAVISFRVWCCLDLC